MILDSEDMPMDEQCERLTYDANKWEFPRDRLKLGEERKHAIFKEVILKVKTLHGCLWPKVTHWDEGRSVRW